LKEPSSQIVLVKQSEGEAEEHRCVVETEEFHLTLMELTKKPAIFQDLFQKVSELINSFSQSARVDDEFLVHYVLPTIDRILNASQISAPCLGNLLESMVRVLKNQDVCVSILGKYDVAELLCKAVQNEGQALNETVFMNLELCVKLVYYNPIKLTPASDQFIK